MDSGPHVFMPMQHGKHFNDRAISPVLSTCQCAVSVCVRMQFFGLLQMLEKGKSVEILEIRRTRNQNHLQPHIKFKANLSYDEALSQDKKENQTKSRHGVWGWHTVLLALFQPAVASAPASWSITVDEDRSSCPFPPSHWQAGAVRAGVLGAPASKAK